MWSRRTPRARAKESRTAKNRFSFESLEARIMLHDGDSGNWLDHALDDDAILDAAALNPPIVSKVVAPLAVTQPSGVGQWGALQNWPIEYINAIMLPTGKVMGYDRTLNLRLWDPTTNTFTSPADPGYQIFCTGVSLLSDGRVLVSGGAVVDTVGLPYAAIYDPFSDSWMQLSNLNAGRWYPSNTTLANGDVLILSGDTNGNVTNPLPQVYDAATGTFRDLTTAEQTLPFYPRTFSAPNGDAFIAGPQQGTEYLDPTGTGTLIPVANRVEPRRDFGSAVMYAPGKILYVGGGSPAVASAEVIDLNQANPTWRSVAPMAFARRNCNATLLPDGEVLINGGNTGSGTYDGNDILTPEIWNPDTETFRTVANEADIRWYHSTSLLLPDGRVLSTSGDNHLTGQVYSPPYLFGGTQPTIASAPGGVNYGDTFFVGTPDAATITNVRWIRLGTATHAQNWDQYAQDAQFTQAAGGLMVSAPPTPNAAPPGYYYLFILKGATPSVAKIIRIGSALPTISAVDAATKEGPNGTTTNLVFTLTLSEARATPVTVQYATADGTALAGQDYTAKTGTVTFAPLTTTQTISIPILGDAVNDPNETFTLNLSAPAGATLARTQAQGLIRDFNSLPVLDIKGLTMVEGDSGTTNANFVVSLSSASTTTVTVNYTTVDGTAKANSDYTPTTGTLTFNPGVTTQTISVPVVGDLTDEPNENFFVQLSAPAGATINTPQAQALIYNNDAPVSASLATSVTINEPGPGTTAQAVITATLSAPSGKTVKLPWTTTTNGTAAAGRDFNPQVGVVTFLPGETSKTFTVTILGDGIKEPNETLVLLEQSEVENANFGNRTTTINIVDTDALPAISLSNASVVEGNSGTANAVFTATLSAPVNQQVTVTYTTNSGTATSGVDFTATTGTITFAANTTTQTFSVPVIGDTAAESNEIFNVVLSNPVGATIAAGQAVGTIVDDDGASLAAAPANLTAIAGYGSVALSWTASAGATSYNIYRGNAPNGEGTTPIATGIVATNYIDTGLTNGKNYYYVVRAVKLQGASYEGSASNEAQIVPSSYNYANSLFGSNQVLSLNGYNVEDILTYSNSLQLTDGGTNQTDSAFTQVPVNIGRFTTQFTFQQLPSYKYTDPLADGMTFTIQGIGPTALGLPGGLLGYGGINNSVAIKFDLFNNNGEGSNSTGLYTNGADPSAANTGIDLTPSGIDLHSGHPFSVNITYDGATLQVSITDSVTQATATQSYTVNIPSIVGGNTAYVGFTGGTGTLTAIQKVTSWVFTPAPAAPSNLQATGASATQVNLSWTNNDPNATSVLIERKTGAAGTYAQIGTPPATSNTYSDATVTAGTTYFYRVRAISGASTSVYSNEVSATAASYVTVLNFSNGFAGATGLQFNGAPAKIVGTSLQLTDGGPTEAGSAFVASPVNVTNFTTQFNFQLLSGTNPTADGMTFTIQGVANTALGGSGGALGYAGIAKSVCIKFDLYSNAGEGPNSTGLYTLGAQPNAVNSINLTGTGIDLHSGHVFNAAMTYDGTTLQVTITDTVTQAKATQSYTVNIPNLVGGNSAYVGFTGGTGGQTAVQSVLNWTYAIAPTMAAPTNLKATAASPTQINLSWTNVDPASASVIVERKTGAGGTYAQIAATTSATANTYSDLTATPGTTYFYRVRATGGANTSPYSAESNVTTPVSADLQITITDGQTSIAAGAAVTYTIVASNAGPAGVTGAGITDTFPSSLTGVTFTAAATGGATGFTASGNGNINDTVNLPSGATITYTVHATLSTAASGTLANTASISAPSGVVDGNLANNSASDTDTITAPTPVINHPSGFSGASDLKFNGAPAKIVGSKLQLTDGGTNEAGSVFSKNTVNVTNFTTQFNFQLLSGTNPTADGMTFTIQGVANTALGGSGGALGYAGIAKSVCIKFDLYSNAGEGPNSTGLYTLGVQPNATGSINLTGTGIDLHSGHVFNAAMTYDGTTLQVTITDTVTQAKATQNYTVNIPNLVGGNSAYVGFTGGTGGQTAVQSVLNWTYSTVVGTQTAQVKTAVANTKTITSSSATASTSVQSSNASKSASGTVGQNSATGKLTTASRATSDFTMTVNALAAGTSRVRTIKKASASSDSDPLVAVPKPSLFQWLRGLLETLDGQR